MGARVKDMFGAERCDEISFFNRTRGRDDPRAPPARDLQSRESDATRPAMDKNPFSAGKTGTSDQGIIGGEKGDRDGDGGFKRQALRDSLPPSPRPR